MAKAKWKHKVANWPFYASIYKKCYFTHNIADMGSMILPEKSYKTGISFFATRTKRTIILPKVEMRSISLPKKTAKIRTVHAYLCKTSLVSRFLPANEACHDFVTIISGIYSTLTFI